MENTEGLERTLEQPTATGYIQRISVCSGGKAQESGIDAVPDPTMTQ